MSDQEIPASRRFRDITARMNEPLEQVHELDIARLSELDERLAELEREKKEVIAREAELRPWLDQQWEIARDETSHEEWLFPWVDPGTDLSASPWDLDQLTRQVDTLVQELREAVRGRGVVAALARARAQAQKRQHGPTGRE